MGIDPRKIFGQRVRQLRKEIGISQEELAGRCGLHRTYVGDIEQGRRNPSLLNIIRIAESFGVSPAKLFEETNNKK
jgi:transcriptional regulator with XRE-family HTH domain